MLSYNLIVKKPLIEKIFWLSFFVISIILIYNAKSIANENLYYYSFSTIVQGFLSLVALLGAVVIYKIQLLENEMIKITIEFSKTSQAIFVPRCNLSSPIELMNSLQLQITSFKEVNRPCDIISVFHEKLNSINNQKSEIRTDLVDFSLFSFVNVGLALINLSLSKLLMSSYPYFVEGCLLVNIFLSLYSLKLALSLIKKSVGYSFRA